MSFKKAFLLFGLLLLVLSACSGQSAEEKIHTHLEEAVTLEQEFEAQQSQITELEKQEQDIYAQVIDLGMEELDEIKKLSEEAIAIIDQRDEKIEIERESINNAKEEFQSIESLIEDLEDDTVKAKGNEMFDTMMERYAVYEDLYTAYKDSLALEKELYTILQEEDVEQQTLNEHIEKINGSYETILDANDTFNELTVTYNELKQEFYEAANIQVTFEEEA